MKKTVFLTGATGTLGWATLQELLSRPDAFDVCVLVRPTKKNKVKMAPLIHKVRIVWGDLMVYDDVLRGVQVSDYVLHVGGMVPPEAIKWPGRTLKVNVVAAQNVVRAILAQPKPNNIKLVYVGSIAQTSNKNVPNHWGRTGDPIHIATHDCYGLSKTIAERIVVESGIKHWVSLRQSAVLYPGILKKVDPYMFYMPLQGVIEWATIEDSARALVNACQPDVPKEFWRRFYHVGSGELYRFSNYEFVCRMFKTLGCAAPEKIFEPQWFAMRNFHGMWFADGEVLDNYLHFRSNTPADDYFQQLAKQLPRYFALVRFVPPFVLKSVMRYFAFKRKQGVQYWVKKRDEERIRVFYENYDEWVNIPSWENYDTSRPVDFYANVSHGYDESKPVEEWTIDDMRQVAEFRGGECVSTRMKKCDLTSPLTWRCAEGHTFEASPTLILLGGHWCPKCLTINN